MSHCKHQRCCQCGARRDTPEHGDECPDAIVMRLMKQGKPEASTRKLIKGKP